MQNVLYQYFLTIVKNETFNWNILPQIHNKHDYVVMHKVCERPATAYVKVFLLNSKRHTAIPYQKKGEFSR